jgi:hypothetical protein
VLVMEVAQVGMVFKMGLQVGVVKFECSSRGTQSGVCLVGCCEFLVSIFRWSKPPHLVTVNPLGEVDAQQQCSTSITEAYNSYQRNPTNDNRFTVTCYLPVDCAGRERESHRSQFDVIK